MDRAAERHGDGESASSASYRGPDRRGRAVASSAAPSKPLLAAFALLTITTLAVVWAMVGLRSSELGWGPEHEGWIVSSVAMLATVTSAVYAMRWRLVGSAPSLWIAGALAVYGSIAVAFPGFVEVFIEPAGGATNLAEVLRPAGVLVVVVLLIMALLSADVEAALRPRRVVAVATLAAVAAVALAARSETFRAAFGPDLHRASSRDDASIIQAAMAGVWVLLGVAFLRASLERGRAMSPWIGLMLLTLAEGRVVLAISVYGDPSWVNASQLLRAVAVGFALVGAIRDLQGAFVEQRLHLLNSLVAASAVEARRRSLEASDEERRHDLHAALAGIAGAATTLERHGEQMSDAERQTILGAVRAEIMRLQEVVRSAERGQRPFDVREAIESAVVVASAQGVDVELDIDAGLVALGRPGELARVVQNLLENARTHAPGSPVQIRAMAAGDRVVVRVDDEGPGVPEEDRELVFQRTWRRDANAPGSGLGLYIADTLVRGQGGSLHVESGAAGGASFVVDLAAAHGSTHR